MEKDRVALFKRDSQGKVVPCGYLDMELAIEAGYTYSEGDLDGLADY